MKKAPSFTLSYTTRNSVLKLLNTYANSLHMEKAICLTQQPLSFMIVVSLPQVYRRLTAESERRTWSTVD